MSTESTQPSQNTPATPSEHDRAEHGIPPEVHDAEPTALPTSDRHHTEITPTKP